MKVVSAEDEATARVIAGIYGAVVTAGIHVAPSIKVAETAKVLENTQRDLNIALMNELAIICDLMNIRTKDVLCAAGTKWNFLNFMPGLVGGHCIGVDPYYLTSRAQELGYEPEVILAGRRLNDSMGRYVAKRITQRLRGETDYRPFHYFDKGNLATIGRGAAVADLNWAQLSGLPAWLIWIFIHLLYIVQFQNRLLVMLQWGWLYISYDRSARLITGENPLPLDL